MPFLIALTIRVHLPDNGSLKGKRKELLSLRAALARRFGASVAEVGDQDLWQRATLAAGIVGRSAGELDHAADGIERYLMSRCVGGVTIERKLLSFGDLED